MTPRQIARRLTEPQKRAVRAFAQQGSLTPADLGWWMQDFAGQPSLTAQGSGRLGGTMAWRLRRKGLASIDADLPKMTKWKLTPLGVRVAEVLRQQEIA